ncbi:restriction system protein [Fodinibius roseus]|uniref:Restriction system protein n=1 Tax=Fodinibius roseus TaxID=1194090 RepID=A0A1M5EBE0_9BACT|nr:restriction endonuclease [Fodinibius roseus]SHF76515.1 restriction system protein [Fodinibius roseus]
MSLWMVRAGRHGEMESTAMEEGLVTIGWHNVKDVSKFQNRDELKKYLSDIDPDASKSKIANNAGQIYRFANEINVGDWVVLPLKTESTVKIGKITSDYKYDESQSIKGVKHYREVNWTESFPRSKFDQDLLYSLGAAMTVCEISRNNAEQRITNMVNGQSSIITRQISDEVEEDIPLDIDQFSRDQISKYIIRKFKGHGLTRIVEEILKAEGFYTRKAEKGPDGGVDILAGKGTLGFDTPKICVQVKSTESEADVSTLRELIGVLDNFNADFGLFVSWGGFKQSAQKLARQSFYKVRLWDADRLLDALFKHYEHFNDELKADLPLKRTWTLVIEDEE